MSDADIKTSRRTNAGQGSEHNQNNFVARKPSTKGYYSQKRNSCSESSFYTLEFRNPHALEKLKGIPTRIIHIANPSALQDKK